MRLMWRTLIVLSFSLAAAAYAADAPPQTIVLASTTSVDNSGLLQAILPGFTKATNISVKVLAQGTGQALDTARRDDADLVRCMILRRKPNSSTKRMASTGDRSRGTTSSSSARKPTRPMSRAVMTLSPP